MRFRKKKQHTCRLRGVYYAISADRQRNEDMTLPHRGETGELAHIENLSRLFVVLAILCILSGCAATHPGEQPASFGKNMDLIEAATRGDLDMVRGFLAQGADINARNDKGVTALYRASFCGHRDVVDLLLANGASVDFKARNGSTPLFAAAQNGYRDVAELLLDKGADINARTDYGATP